MIWSSSFHNRESSCLLCSIKEILALQSLARPSPRRMGYVQEPMWLMQGEMDTRRKAFLPLLWVLEPQTGRKGTIRAPIRGSASRSTHVIPCSPYSKLVRTYFAINSTEGHSPKSQLVSGRAMTWIQISPSLNLPTVQLHVTRTGILLPLDYTEDERVLITPGVCRASESNKPSSHSLSNH